MTLSEPNLDFEVTISLQQNLQRQRSSVERPVCDRMSFLFFAAMVMTVDGVCYGGWHSNFSNEYCADLDERNHSTARSICQSKDADLASITSDAECDYILGFLSVNRL